MNKDLQKLIKKADSMSKYVPLTEVFSLMKDLLAAYREDQIVKRDIAMIDAEKELLIQQMSMKYDLYYKVFAQI